MLSPIITSDCDILSGQLQSTMQGASPGISLNTELQKGRVFLPIAYREQISGNACAFSSFCNRPLSGPILISMADMQAFISSLSAHSSDKLFYNLSSSDGADMEIRQRSIEMI